MRFKRITIIRTRKPSEGDLNEKLQWFGGTLGLFGSRDKDKSCFRIFIVLLRNMKDEGAISSDDIADRTGLSRGTVVHHLNKLMKSGIVTSEKSGYQVKVDRLEELVDVLKSEVERSFKNLKDVAEELDNNLGL